MKKIVILGSTGSIGRQTLEVAAVWPEEFRVVGLVARSNLDLLLTQVNEFKPAYVGLTSPEQAGLFSEKLKAIPMAGYKPKLLAGEEEIKRLVGLKEVDLVVVAIVGLAALGVTVAAIKARKTVALASKEVLVAAGSVIVKMLRQSGTALLPIDSEHSAILQCLTGAGGQRFMTAGKKSEDFTGIFPYEYLSEIILTASGGPFWRFPGKDLSKVTPAEALAHPNWKMGRKISIDSATLMNKGLEVIEAHWFFGLPYERIKVVVHPQSYVHSLVKFCDSSILGQISPPDMKLPILLALTWPRRLDSVWPAADLTKLSPLEFSEVEADRFLALGLAYQAGRQGGTYPCVLNAANEIAVEYFLSEKIPFTDIPRIVERVLDQHTSVNQPELEDIIAADDWGRKKAQNLAGSLL